MADKPTQITQDAAPARSGKRRNPLGRLFRLVVWLAVIVAIAAAAVKFYFAPKLIAAEVEKSLGGYWVGSVEVGGVAFNYFGPILLHGLVLRAQAGQTWLAEDTVTVELEDWPGLHPRVTQLRSRRLAVTVYEGKSLPVTAPASGEPSDLFDLRDVLVNGADLTIVRTDGRRGTFEGVHIEANLRGEQWHVQARSGESYILTGRLRRSVDDAGSTVLAFVGQATLPGGKANVTASGIASADTGNKLNVTLDVVADMCGGYATLHAGLIVPTAGPPKANISLAAADLDLRAFTTAWRFAEPLDGRLVSLQFDASLTSANLDGMTANGLLFLDDMTVVPDSPLDAILEAISPDSVTQDRSDVQAVFSMDGPVVTIHSGSIGGELISLDIEPGGTINLRTHELDGVVVVVVMKDISRVLSFLPMINVMTDMSNDLTRSRITGTWDAPVPIPLAMDRLTGGTLGLIRNIAPSGGQLGGLIFAPMESIFNALPPLVPTNGE